MQFQSSNPYAQTGYTGNLEEMLTYMFKQPGWEQKVLAGAGISLVPILNFATTGYMLDTMGRVRTNQTPPLPDWSENIGKFFTDGLMLVIINLIYSLPAVVLALLGSGAFAGMSAMTDNPDAVGMVGLGVGIILMILMFIYALILFFWAQGVIVNYAMKRTFASGFSITRSFKARSMRPMAGPSCMPSAIKSFPSTASDPKGEPMTRLRSSSTMWSKRVRLVVKSASSNVGVASAILNSRQRENSSPRSRMRRRTPLGPHSSGRMCMATSRRTAAMSSCEKRRRSSASCARRSLTSSCL